MVKVGADMGAMLVCGAGRSMLNWTRCADARLL